MIAGIGAVWNQPITWIVIVIGVVLGGIHTFALRPTGSGGASPPGLRTSIGAGLTVSGILLSGVFLVLQLHKAALSGPEVADLFVAAIWLVISMLFGLYATFVSVTRPGLGYGVGLCFGYQLISLLCGVVAFLVGMADLVSHLLNS